MHQTRQRGNRYQAFLAGYKKNYKVHESHATRKDRTNV